MAHASDHHALLLQNLKDAGCDSETIEKCMTQFQKTIPPECCGFYPNIGASCWMQYIPAKRKLTVLII